MAPMSDFEFVQKQYFTYVVNIKELVETSPQTLEEIYTQLPKHSNVVKRMWRMFVHGDYAVMIDAEDDFSCLNVSFWHQSSDPSECYPIADTDIL